MSARSLAWLPKHGYPRCKGCLVYTYTCMASRSTVAVGSGVPRGGILSIVVSVFFLDTVRSLASKMVTPFGLERESFVEKKGRTQVLIAFIRLTRPSIHSVHRQPILRSIHRQAIDSIHWQLG